MINTVLFDIDNTLYDYDAAHKIAFQAVTEYARRTFGLTAEEFSALHKQGSALLQRRVGSVTAAIHNRLIRYQIMLEIIKKPFSHALKMSDTYWSAFLDAMEPAHALRETIAGLKERGFTLGIGTNMTADYQYAKLAKLGILEELDFMVTSEEAGAEKPDRKLFDCCVQKAGCPAGACAFVGDSLESDVMGALRAGMVPVWLCAEPRACGADVRRIASLAELPALLESL